MSSSIRKLGSGRLIVLILLEKVKQGWSEARLKNYKTVLALKSHSELVHELLKERECNAAHEDQSH